MTDSAENIIRLELRFYGQVQGVGFRYRAYHAANGLRLTGWVENLPDGSVLCEVQGERGLIDRMIGQIAEGRYVGISDLRTKKLPLKEGERSFGIR